MAKVIQADRERAHDYWLSCGIPNANTLAGINDQGDLIQAFAAHREASTAKLEADMAVMAVALTKIANDPYQYGQRVQRLKKIASEALTRIQGEYRSGEVSDA